MPTELRNGAIGIASASARISGMIAPFIGGPLVRKLGNFIIEHSLVTVPLNTLS